MGIRSYNFQKKIKLKIVDINFISHHRAIIHERFDFDACEQIKINQQISTDKFNKSKQYDKTNLAK